MNTKNFLCAHFFFHRDVCFYLVKKGKKNHIKPNKPAVKILFLLLKKMAQMYQFILTVLMETSIKGSLWRLSKPTSLKLLQLQNKRKVKYLKIPKVKLSNNGLSQSIARKKLNAFCHLERKYTAGDYRNTKPIIDKELTTWQNIQLYTGKITLGLLGLTILAF